MSCKYHGEPTQLQPQLGYDEPRHFPPYRRVSRWNLGCVVIKMPLMGLTRKKDRSWDRRGGGVDFIAGNSPRVRIKAEALLLQPHVFFVILAIALMFLHFERQKPNLSIQPRVCAVEGVSVTLKVRVFLHKLQYARLSTSLECHGSEQGLSMGCLPISILLEHHHVAFIPIIIINRLFYFGKKQSFE